MQVMSVRSTSINVFIRRQFETSRTCFRPLLLKCFIVCVVLSDDGNLSNTYQQCFACSIIVEELQDTEKRC